MSFLNKHRFFLVLSCSALFAISLTAQSLYWLDASFYTPTIGKSAADGSNIQTTALNASSLPEALTYSYPDKKILWTELQFSGASIHGADTSFVTDSLLVTNSSSVRGLAVDIDSNWIYYATSNLQTKPKINRIRPDGTGSETVLILDSISGNPRAIAIDAVTRYLYWTEFTQGVINRVNLDNTITTQTIVTALSGPVGLAVDHTSQKLYWSEANANTISRSNLDGSSKSTILYSLSTPNYLTIDTIDGFVYWTEIGTPRIRKATISGASIETLPITVSHPTGIQFAPHEETALSVELTLFTGITKGKVVELAWQTATEVNNHGFEIERSPAVNRSLRVNGSLAWTKIGFVAGYGNSNSPKSYSYVDATAKGKFIYRLKQIDNDGAFEYHGMVEVNASGAVTKFELAQNFPNPFNPETKISFEIPVSGFVSLKVFDMLGKEIATLVNGMQEVGEQNVTFTASNYPSGMYFYILRSGNFVETKKMLLVK